MISPQGVWQWVWLLARLLHRVVDLLPALWPRVGPGVLVNLSVDLVTGGGLEIGGDQHVICPLHDCSVVLQVVTLQVLGAPPAGPLLAALDQGGNDDGEDDDSDDATDTANDDGPVQGVAGQVVHIHLVQRCVITAGSLDNVTLL